jgi:hypothetical protein
MKERRNKTCSSRKKRMVFLSKSVKCFCAVLHSKKFQSIGHSLCIKRKADVGKPDKRWTVVTGTYKELRTQSVKSVMLIMRTECNRRLVINTDEKDLMF